MKRTAINPWSWSLSRGYHQAEAVTGHTRTLYLAGQAAIDGSGVPQHPGDMESQITLALDNLETVLLAAGMTLANVIRLNIYTTDVDLLFRHYAPLVTRRVAAGVAPPCTVLGVTRLAHPDLLVELEATAVA